MREYAMNETSRDVVVVGGGISGLTAAWRLKKAGVDVCLIESKSQVGGCATTKQRDGFLLEQGPFNVIVRHEAFEELLADMSDEINVVTASRAARARYIYHHGRLHKVPTNPVSLATTGLLSLWARLRLISGLLYSRQAKGEETIEQVVTRRFGKEMADTIVSAVIAGIFAGDIRKLSLKGCFPTVHGVDAEARSLIGYGIRMALGGKKERRKRRWRGLVSIDEGLGGLTAALGRRLGADLLEGCTVHSVGAAGSEDGGGYIVKYSGGKDGAGSVRGRRVVLATPVYRTAELIRPLAPGASGLLESIESTSLVVLNLGFRAADIGHPMQGYGFLVPHNEPEFPLLGVLWADSIFPHHAPAGHRLIRVFIGGARDPEAVSQSDDALLARSMDAIRPLLQVRGEPRLVDVCRWKNAVPQNQVGHHERIGRVRSVVGGLDGLTLIGNYLEGVSLNDCVRVASKVAEGLAGEVVPARRGDVGAGSSVPAAAVGAE
jgi:oxygen-dependent protoporphyrinogen oxidase